jgi:hypothetical protein
MAVILFLLEVDYTLECKDDTIPAELKVQL